MNLQQQLRKRQPQSVPQNGHDVESEPAQKLHLPLDQNVRVLGKSELFTQEKAVKKRGPRKTKNDEDNLLRDFADPFAEEKSSVIGIYFLN